MTTRDRCPACLSQDVAVAAGVWGACDLVRCRTCRTEFLAPQPSDERLGQIYGADYYTPWSAEAADTVDAMKRLTFAPMLDACDPAPGRSVLDLGCATGRSWPKPHEGRDDLRHRPEPGSDRDGSGTGTRRAPARGRGRRSAVPGRVARRGGDDRLHRARARSRSRAVGRPEITRPGSKLVISTPRRRFLMRSASGRHWPQYREEHLTYFSRGGLGALLCRTGFSSRRCRPTRKAITLAYAYGQAVAYPVPVLSGATSVAYRTLPALRHRTLRVGMGEMTVVAVRDAD